MTKNYVKMSVYLTKEQRKFIKMLGKSVEVSNSEVVRSLIENEIARSKDYGKSLSPPINIKR